MTANKGGIGQLARRASRLPLARIAGAMLGAALAFLCLAMPVEMLEQGAQALNLPAFLAAAAPPLGMKARLIVAILGGGLGFAAGALPVWLLGRIGAPRLARPKPEPVFVSEGPEEEPAPLRRRFSARDYAESEAPRPIFAARELGLPMDEVVEDRPLVLQAPDPEQAFVAQEEKEEEDFLDLGAFPIADVTDERPPVVDAVPEPAPAPPPPSIKAPAELPSSIPALMARLEAGIVRRGLAPEQRPVRNDVPRPTVASVMRKAPDDMDSALRNALQELHRVAVGRA